MQQQIDEIIDFWFGELTQEGCASKEHTARWWKKDPAFDREIRGRFAACGCAVGPTT